MSGDGVRETVVVRGLSWGFCLPTFAVAAAALLVAVGFLVAISRVAFPWMPQDASALLWSEPVLPLSVLAFLVGVSASLAKSVFVKRAGRVELTDEGVVFRRRGIFSRKIAWPELEAYGDAHASEIDLVRRGLRHPRPADAIPARDEATRTAVLGVLDGHGLRRVEVPRAEWPALVRAATVGLASSLLLVVAIHAFNARRRRFDDLAAGRLSDAQATALVTESFTVKCGIRPKIGADDALVVRHTWTFRPVLSLDPVRVAKVDMTLRIEVDGRVQWETKQTGVAAPLCPFLDARKVAAWRRLWQFPAGFPNNANVPLWHRLSPGPHSVRVVTGFQMNNGACTKETLQTFEVVPGSDAAESIRLVPGAVPEFTLEALPSSDVFTPRLVLARDLEHALSVREDFFEGEKLFASGKFFARAHGRSSQGEWGGPAPNQLPSGHHVLKVRFTPDQKFAFDRDAEVTEILGETFERELVVDVP
jgi:hypothetical protein